MNAPRPDRRRLLRELYGFWCTCARCQREKHEPPKEAPELEGLKDEKELLTKVRYSMAKKGVDDGSIDTSALNCETNPLDTDEHNEHANVDEQNSALPVESTTSKVGRLPEDQEIPVEGA